MSDAMYIVFGFMICVMVFLLFSNRKVDKSIDKLHKFNEHRGQRLDKLLATEDRTAVQH